MYDSDSDFGNFLINLQLQFELLYDDLLLLFFDLIFYLLLWQV